MAANTRVHAAPGWAQGELITPAQQTRVDLNGAGAVARGSSQTGWRHCPIVPVDTVNAAGTVRLAYPDPATGNLLTEKDADYLWIPLQGLPSGHVLNKVNLYVLPAGGHAAQPGTLPQIEVYSKGLTGAVVLLGTGSHVWVDVATYHAGIVLETNDFAATINNATASYWVRFRLEDDPNGVAGLELKSLRAYCTLDTSEGGADFKFWP